MKGDDVNDLMLHTAGWCMFPFVAFMIGGAVTDTPWALGVGGAFLAVICVCAFIGMVVSPFL